MLSDIACTESGSQEFKPDKCHPRSYDLGPPVPPKNNLDPQRWDDKYPYARARRVNQLRLSSAGFKSVPRPYASTPIKAVHLPSERRDKPSKKKPTVVTVLIRVAWFLLLFSRSSARLTFSSYYPYTSMMRGDIRLTYLTKTFVNAIARTKGFWIAPTGCP